MSIRLESLKQLKDLILLNLKDESIKVFLFGSSAREDYENGSDIDIGLLPKESVNENIITILKEKIEHLNIPYKVELVNFRETSEEFVNDAMKDAVIWKD
ncbi:MAG: nucleotidyltransferase domain-containing protein [Candidatus Omnitrophica bacterium]|nr:nucleotidyltransferase domain-containing protein [Candidatus Omnitrophota bacterium]